MTGPAPPSINLKKGLRSTYFHDRLSYVTTTLPKTSLPPGGSSPDDFARTLPVASQAAVIRSGIQKKADSYRNFSSGWYAAFTALRMVNWT